MPGTNGSARRYVVDASVIAKWLLPEADVAPADRLRDLAVGGECRLLAPDLWRIEIANALWARTRRGANRLHETDAADALAVVSRMPVVTVASEELLALAFDVALDASITVYDALYAALSLRERAPLVTADLRLRDRLLARWPEFGVVALAEV